MVSRRFARQITSNDLIYDLARIYTVDLVQECEHELVRINYIKSVFACDFERNILFDCENDFTRDCAGDFTLKRNNFRTRLRE